MAELDPDIETVWVLTRVFHDGSGLEVVRAYAHKQRADEDLDLVEDNPAMRYVLTEVPVYRNGNS